ncbi:MAG: 3'(2'),5'-bisphosphate nucleotidase CysQ, partial [Desulfovibrionales bacterium]
MKRTGTSMQDLISSAIRASIKAGKEILSIYEKGFQVEYKEDKSPLTEADRRSHSLIVQELTDFSIPILSEEGIEIPYESRRQWDMLWIVDPLDGTKEFIKRNGEFTVNIALVQNQEPIGGVIYVPVSDTLYFALRGRGSWKAQDAGQSRNRSALSHWENGAVRLPHASADTRPYTVVGSRSHKTPEVESLVGDMRKKHTDLEFVSAGSSLKFCLVAEGLADIYPRLGPTMEWDTAAGQAVV